ncbi:TetR/AcrR family transcriptional regulator [Sporosarcina sp. Marseille-Q4063]|uniref:TetR/AcrR family transcriptional regulator n=1 Tax=Sporosarcina sp. Marseille-Q4063 TaxID=2810514 RepID=UPI001BB04EC5|nr:TetR/AcrR family transcriptional regulator [Sporosarcina sp. Marseille-Q4063]QUW22889.1 TetR/AcrR family transcriptional regulator [Sporosarcina sp. Marseille-Q4063]
MTTKFENVDVEKQRVILNAALKEFADKGYEQASTNQIVKDADIGKGMLFYYFTNKKKLYAYLVDYCINILEEEYLERVDYSHTDIFERLKIISKVKWEFLVKYPEAINFISTLFVKNPDQLESGLNKRFQAIQEKWTSVLYENIDFSLFREDVDSKKAFELVQWSLHGYEENLKSRLQDQVISDIDYEFYFEEFYEYVDVLKTAFYK